jgi:hypothetical protein
VVSGELHGLVSGAASAPGSGGSWRVTGSDGAVRSDCRLSGPGCGGCGPPFVVTDQG